MSDEPKLILHRQNLRIERQVHPFHEIFHFNFEAFPQIDLRTDKLCRPVSLNNNPSAVNIDA